MGKRLGRAAKILWHQGVLVAVLLGLTAYRVINGRWEVDLALLWWWLGAVIGFMLIFAEGAFYALWQSPGEVMATKIKDIFSGNKIRMDSGKEGEKRIIRSVVFWGVWMMMAVLTVTSVTAPLGRGFMLGLGLHLILEAGEDMMNGNIRPWFWQIKREMDKGEMKTAIWGMLVLSLLFCIGL